MWNHWHGNTSTEGTLPHANVAANHQQQQQQQQPQDMDMMQMMAPDQTSYEDLNMFNTFNE